MNKNVIFSLIALGFCNSGCQNIQTNKTQFEKIDSSANPSSNNIIQSDTTKNIVYFWDKIDFSDTSRLYSPDYGEQNFSNYIHLFTLSNEESIIISIKKLIEKSKNNSNILRHFENLFAKYLYDVNSPFYSEKFYVIVLETLVKSDHIDSIQKSKYKTLLKLASRNNIGTIASDFNFKTSDQENNYLHNYKSNYIILFFYQPDCPNCQESIEYLKKDPLFNAKIKEKDLTILLIYPDGNYDIWNDYKHNIPSNWVNGIDINQNILKKGLYDLKASPTLYLLNKDKEVVLKDCLIQEIINYPY